MPGKHVSIKSIIFVSTTDKDLKARKNLWIKLPLICLTLEQSLCETITLIPPHKALYC